jgi:hypothetical protein
MDEELGIGHAKALSDAWAFKPVGLCEDSILRDGHLKGELDPLLRGKQGLLGRRLSDLPPGRRLQMHGFQSDAMCAVVDHGNAHRERSTPDGVLRRGNGLDLQTQRALQGRLVLLPLQTQGAIDPVRRKGIQCPGGQCLAQATNALIALP